VLPIDGFSFGVAGLQWCVWLFSGLIVLIVLVVLRYLLLVRLVVCGATVAMLVLVLCWHGVELGGVFVSIQLQWSVWCSPVPSLEACLEVMFFR
jgi:hypothetical protein